MNPPISEAELVALTQLVMVCGFGLCVLFGAIAARTNFCTMGAIADVVTFGDTTRLRMWMLAVAVATFGFNAMVGLGWLHAADSLYGGPRVAWLSALVGGALFGVGMVLASGCGSKNLVRLGGGSLKSLVVLIVLGLAAFATLKGITGVLRVASVDRVVVELRPSQDLPTLLGAASGWPVQTAAPWLGAIVAAALIGWVLGRPEGRRSEVWLGGLGIGGVIVAMWWVSGRLGHVAEDPTTLAEAFVATNSHRMEALSMVAPVAYAIDWLLYFSDQRNVLTLGIVCMAGVVVGSAIVSIAGGSFRWQGFAGTADTATHLVGAVLMGVGGVTALGCTIGQGLSGLSTLSLGSVIAVLGIVCGAWLALRWQQWRIEREAA